MNTTLASSNTPSAAGPGSRFAPRNWLPHERPMMPGSPSTPLHPTRRRIAFALVGTVISLTGGFSNALVTANLLNLQGALGVYAAEAAWLPAAYVMTNVSMNLLLVKFRQEFGLRLFAQVFLALYAVVAFAHLFVNDLGSAIAVRAAHGVAGAALSSLGFFYMLQAFPAAHRLKGIALSLGITQLALPLARLMPVSVLEASEWRGLYLFELGLTLITLGCVSGLRLPPGDRIKTFEKLDFLTFLLFAPGMALLCAVLALGRSLWWFETPWLGQALAGSVVLLTAALAIEHFRRNPLLNTRWLTSAAMLRLGFLIVLARVVLSEQSVGAVGFLQALGLSYDQMHPMFLAVLAGTAAGSVVSALTIDPKRLHLPIIAALAMMIAGASMDADATNLTRPSDMLTSQFLLAFGGSLFLAPAMVAGIGQVVTQPKNLVSWTVIFSINQNLGGLLGTALLGSLQTWREKFHSSQLNEHLTLLDPQVAARLQGSAAAYGRVVTDPVLRGAQGSTALGSTASREANVLAYNDVFLAIAAVAALTLLAFGVQVLRLQLQARRAASASVPTDHRTPTDAA